MSEGFFRVFRAAEAPEELTELAPNHWSGDPIVVVEKAADLALISMAADAARALSPPLTTLKLCETLTYYVYVMERP